MFDSTGASTYGLDRIRELEAINAQITRHRDHLAGILRQIADPSYVGNYDAEAVERIYREWAQNALDGSDRG